MDAVIQIQVLILRAGVGMVSGRERCLFLGLVSGVDSRSDRGVVIMIFLVADLIRACG